MVIETGKTLWVNYFCLSGNMLQKVKMSLTKTVYKKIKDRCSHSYAETISKFSLLTMTL